jgi:transcription elongation factor Elf1
MSEPIITQADIDLFKGSGELMRCPFCNSHAISYGVIIKRGTRWEVHCKKCTASVFSSSVDQEKARSKAVALWNRRAK